MVSTTDRSAAIPACASPVTIPITLSPEIEAKAEQLCEELGCDTIEDLLDKLTRQATAQPAGARVTPGVAS